MSLLGKNKKSTTFNAAKIKTQMSMEFNIKEIFNFQLRKERVEGKAEDVTWRGQNMETRVIYNSGRVCLFCFLKGRNEQRVKS